MPGTEIFKAATSRIYAFQLVDVVSLGAHIVWLLKGSDLIMLFLQKECVLTFNEIESLARLFYSMGVNKN